MKQDYNIINVNYSNIDYSEPTTKDMIIIIPYFNPCDSVNIFNNLKTVKKSLNEASIPYCIGEILFDNQKSINVDRESNIFTYKTNSYMFYKENIINMLLDKIPEEYTKVCVMDADIMFQNKEWYNIISSSLNKMTVCHPFKESIWLDKRYRHIHANKSIVETPGCDKDGSRGHPGFIWAFNKEWLSTNKLFELCVIGGGDTIFASSILNLSHSKVWLNESYAEYLKTFNHPTHIGNADLTVFHLYHGSILNRQYDSRNKLMMNLLSFYKFTDISQLVEKDEHGLLKWKDEYKQKCNQVLLTYFKNRKDDK
jgi:hypothetical protein